MRFRFFEGAFFAIGLLMLSACPPPANENGGTNGTGNGATEDGGAGQNDAGTPEDAGPGGSDAGPDGIIWGWRCDVEGLNCPICTYIPSAWGGSGVCTDTCASDEDCPAVDGLPWSCHLDSQICLPLCDDGETCPAGTECLNDGVDDYCQNIAEPCSRDADCSDDEVCQWGFVDGKTVPVCVPPHPRGLEGGDFCDPLGPPECQAFCLFEGRCGAFCAADTDCPQGMLCGGTFQFEPGEDPLDPVDDHFVAYGVCLVWAGSGNACSRDADCESGEVCAVFDGSDGDRTTRCRLPDPAHLEVGEINQDDPRTPDVQEPFAACATNAVQNIDWTPRCAQICTTEADCAGGPDGFLCSENAIDADTQVGLCLPNVSGCEGADDCADADQACRIALDDGGLIGQCAAEVGNAQFGDACAFGGAINRMPRGCVEDADCISLGEDFECAQAQGICVVTPVARCQAFCTYDRVCTEACIADADCGDVARFYCGQSQFITFNGFTPNDRSDDVFAEAGICFEFPGSRDSCDQDSDCQNGEVCGLFLNSATTAEGRCRSPVANGAAPGEACSQLVDSDVQCANNLCDYLDGDGNRDTGTCAALCATNADCGPGRSCLDVYPFDDDRVVKACRADGAAEGP
jgi:hypothetical protein